MLPAVKPLLILIAGPYMSGTGGDPAKIAANRARLESFALPIYERGHLPMIGEWLAFQLFMRLAGVSRAIRCSRIISTRWQRGCWNVATRCCGFLVIRGGQIMMFRARGNWDYPFIPMSMKFLPLTTDIMHFGNKKAHFDLLDGILLNLKSS